MAVRIVGVDLPQNKKRRDCLDIYLRHRPQCRQHHPHEGRYVDRDIKVKDWTDAQAAAVREVIRTEYKVEGDLRSEIQLNIKRLMDIGCYRGIRHRIGLPVRGQSTKNNARTRKAARKQSLTRRKLLNKIKVWQRRQSQLKRGMSRLTPKVSSTCIALSTTLSFALPTARPGHILELGRQDGLQGV